jgi:[acyl-carrier-protein] S-malonyltransferase
MAALLGLDDEKVIAACAAAAQGQVVSAANFNSPGQVVIAGHAAAVARAVEAAKAAGAKRAVMLAVSAPFHCALMLPAARRLVERLAQVPFAVPRIPLVNNVDVAVCDEPDRIRDALVRQAHSPVRWVEIVRAIAARGASRIYECGPGKVLGPLSKKIEASLAGGGAMADLAALDQAIADSK